jgi:hypothetical protein
MGGKRGARVPYTNWWWAVTLLNLLIGAIIEGGNIPWAPQGSNLLLEASVVCQR